LTNVTVPAGVTSIGAYVFSGCFDLGNVTIPSGVNNIGYGAFEGCASLTGFYFKGNAPTIDASGFVSDDNATVFYLLGNTGWSSTFAGRPALLWNPLIQTRDGSFGISNNQFGFNITGTNSFAVVVEVCTNLSNPVWTPVQTVTLTNGSFYFREPLQTNIPCRFYGLGLP
jgi:hypothetical protein